MADELDAAVDRVLQFPSQARARAIGNAAANPQQAGEAIQLSRQSGVPAEVIDADVPGFKETLAQNKITRFLENPKIMDYVEQSPLASKVSNDDYEKLDKVSKSLTDLAGPAMLHWIYNRAANSPVLGGIQSGFGSEPVGITKEDFKAYPEIYNNFDERVRPFLKTPLALPVVGLEAAARTLPRVIGAGITGLAAAGAETYRQLSNAPDRDAWAGRLARDFGIIGQGVLVESGFKPGAMLSPFYKDLAKAAAKDAAKPELSPAARTMLDNGVMPPPGADFIVDQAHVAQAKVDGLKLDRVIQDVQESSTKERAPSAMAEFARLHTGEEISLSADKIADLYAKAGKAVEDGDGLFGFVPDLERKMQAGLDTGVEVKIPLADYVAHVDPTVHEAIKGDLRLRVEGVTVEEGKELGKGKAEDYIPKEGELPAPTEPAAQALAATKASLYLRPLFADAKAAGMMTETELKQYSAKIEMAQDREAQRITKSTEKEMKKSPQELIDNAIELALADDYADIMSQETRMLARQAGGEVPLTRDEVKTWVKDNFAQEKMANIGDWESLRRAVDRGGRDAEKALLAGKFEDAFKAKQRQLLAFLGMKELDAFQKKFDSTERKIDRLVSEPKIASLDQAHLEQAQALLAELGYPRNFDPTLPLKPLSEFVADSEGQLAVAHYLTDLRGRTVQDLTTAEYLDLAKSLQSIEHVGRDLKKVENVHGKADFDNVIFDAVKELDRFDPVLQPYHPTFRQKTGGFLRALGAPTMLVERMFDYTDKFNPRGPITAYIDRPLRDSFRNEIELSEKAVAKFREIQQYTDRTINEPIVNTVIPNRDSITGIADLDRKNLREIMGYMGSRSGAEKLIKGFKPAEAADQWYYTHREAQEAAIWKLIDANATKADWQWVQGMWEIYSDLHGKAQEMILRDTGVPLEGIAAREIENAHGKWTGGYWPINYDRVRSPIDQIIGAKDPIFDTHYKRAATPHSYTLPRTEFAAPLDLSGVLHWSEIQGQIHDISFREAVRNAAKFVNSPEFMSAFGRAWGPQNSALLRGWLKDIANSHSFDENYAKGATHVLNLVRQNTVAALTYLNPGTVYKHGLTAAGMSSEQVGTVALAGATRDLGFSGVLEAAKSLASVRWEPPAPAHMQAIKELMHPGKGEEAFSFVMDNSPLMRNRQRLYEDTLRGAYEKSSNADLLQTAGEVRHFSLMIGRFPVALSDAVSAIPTWLAKYKEVIANSPEVDLAKVKKDAIFEADRAVGRAHGSSFIGDKSAIMRMGNSPEAAVAKYFTALFNFWNHAQANVLQLAWDTKAFAKGENEPGAHWEVLARRYFKYVILPIIVEETASAPLDEHNHGFGTKALLATVRFFGGMLPIVRDFTNALAFGNEPSVGMMGTIAKEMTKAGTDAKRLAEGKPINKDWLAHLTTAVGISTGLGGPQVGKTTGFLADLYSGKDKVDSSKGFVPAFNAYRQGLRTGHSKPRVFK